jgi:transposase InsO family protein
MPWKKNTVMSLKQEFVSLASRSDANMRALCQRFSISPMTGYKWLHRFREEGYEGLKEHSRRPRHSPGETDLTDEGLILMAYELYPAWGARKLKALLENHGFPMPAASTIVSILKRHGLRQREANEQPAVHRFELSAPNKGWQMDFKGHFETAFGRSHPLTILDDCSRYLLCLAHCRAETRENVQTQLIRVFERFGLPERIMADNGAPWANSHGDYTGLELWMMRQSIRVGHSRAYHPQTQGKLERLHRSLKVELLQGRWFRSEEEIQSAFDEWRDAYNCLRPHSSLGMQPPASRYQISNRSYNPNPPEPDYGEMEVRRVNRPGYISFKGKSLKIGEAFRNECVGLAESGEDGIYKVWWYSTPIGAIDFKNKLCFIGRNHLKKMEEARAQKIEIPC